MAKAAAKGTLKGERDVKKLVARIKAAGRMEHVAHAAPAKGKT